MSPDDEWLCSDLVNGHHCNTLNPRTAWVCSACQGPRAPTMNRDVNPNLTARVTAKRHMRATGGRFGRGDEGRRDA